MVPSQNLVAVWRDGPDLTDEQRAAALEKLTSAVVTGGMTPQAVVALRSSTPTWMWTSGHSRTATR